MEKRKLVLSEDDLKELIRMEYGCTDIQIKVDDDGKIVAVVSYLYK